MSRLRATIVACLTLAIAALPAAEVSAYTGSSEAPSISEHADCCPEGEACATPASATQAKGHHGEDHCPDHPACGGKCLCLGLGLTAVLPAASGALVTPIPIDEAGRIAESAASLAYIPPAPPPRI